jgi:hypothetical protein
MSWSSASTTLRVDHLGSYGYGRDTSPNIDILGKQGVVFDDAVALAPWTLPSTGTILSSLEPWQHGAELQGQTRNLEHDAPLGFRPEVRTLAELARARGFRTACSRKSVPARACGRVRFSLDGKAGPRRGVGLAGRRMDPGASAPTVLPVFPSSWTCISLCSRRSLISTTFPVATAGAAVPSIRTGFCFGGWINRSHRSSPDIVLTRSVSMTGL